MGRAKEIIVKVIPSKIANEFVKKNHYSGKVVMSKLHFGCFLDDKLHGVLQYGDPFVKKNVVDFVDNSLWNEFLELNRMAFDDYLPKYSESRCIAISIKLIRKNAPHIKWILSYSDATDCGDGTIYRASGFFLTGIKKNFNLMTKDNDTISVIGFNSSDKIKKRLNYDNTGIRSFLSKKGYKPKVGYQLRYIYLIDKTCKITVPILPFSKIDEMGAGMYKGKKITLQERKVKLSDVVDSNSNSSLES
jgi:hypothetical protein